MSIKRIFLFCLALICTQTVTAEPSYEVMKSCQKGEAIHSTITVTKLNIGTGYSDHPAQGCEDQYEIKHGGKIFGSVLCGHDLYFYAGQKKLKAKSATDMTNDPAVPPSFFYSAISDWFKIDDGQNSYLCVSGPLSENSLNQDRTLYYIVEGVFDDRAPLRAYFYYFGDPK